MIRIQFNTSARAGLAILLAAVLAGCDRNDVKVYEVPKESAAPPNVSAMPWTVPAGWVEEPLTAMVLAKFSASERDARAEITVSSFDGPMGGLPANINRWRMQVGLPPVDEATATQAATPLDVQSEKASLVEIGGKSARLVGVIVPHGDQTWFFKIMGDERVVNREKDAFIKFVQTVKFPHAP